MPFPLGHARQVAGDLELIAANGPRPRQVLLQEHSGGALEGTAAVVLGPKGNDCCPLLTGVRTQLEGVLTLNLCHLCTVTCSIRGRVGQGIWGQPPVRLLMLSRPAPGFSAKYRRAHERQRAALLLAGA